VAAILEAARRTLAERPGASMQEIAEAAGLHRATVHRHFASRDDLITALRARSLEEVAAGLDAARLDVGPAREALARATVATLEVSERYRVPRFAALFGPATLVQQGRLRASVAEVIERGQREEGLRADLPAEVLTAAWGGLMVGFLPDLYDGSLDVDQAAGLALQVLLGHGS
jgi:TetR/AcrR family transcriptional regulator, mexCD-oprJ operon repressor